MANRKLSIGCVLIMGGALTNCGGSVETKGSDPAGGGKDGGGFVGVPISGGFQGTMPGGSGGWVGTCCPGVGGSVGIGGLGPGSTGAGSGPYVPGAGAGGYVGVPPILGEGGYVGVEPQGGAAGWDTGAGGEPEVSGGAATGGDDGI